MRRTRREGATIGTALACLGLGLLLISATLFIVPAALTRYGANSSYESKTQSKVGVSDSFKAVTKTANAGESGMNSAGTNANAVKSKSFASLRKGQGVESKDRIVETPNSKGNDLRKNSKEVKQASDNAYVTLISGIDETFKYRGFLYACIIMKKALSVLGSTADFIAMVGYADSENISAYESDMDLLRNAGVIIHELPRLVHEKHDLSFAEMALLKITPWSFTQYKKVQFFDGDVMPTKNMDCLFELDLNTFTAGAVSPLNSGWYLAIPDLDAYTFMRDKAIWRLSRDWDQEKGWGVPMPKGLTVRGGQPASTLWDFNGSDMDQGLLLHYHVITHGDAMLVDTGTRSTRVFDNPGGLLKQLSPKKVPTIDALSCCKAEKVANPTSMFAHFTGRQKPWMLNYDNERSTKEAERKMKNKDVKQWFKHLDSLSIEGVNSKTMADLHLGSPLGFWNHNFPKGGFEKKEG